MSTLLVRFAPCADDPDYLEVNQQDIWLLKVTPLYVHRVDGAFAIYKPALKTLAHLNLREDDLPRRLYMRRQDRESAVTDIQQAMLDGEFRHIAQQGDPAMVKLALSSLFEEALAEPRISVLANFKPLLQVISDAYGADPRLLQGFALVAGEGYSLAEHGVNVMALVMGAGLRLGLKEEMVLDLALGGLLHDLGQASLPDVLAKPPAQVNDQEFARYQDPSPGGTAPA